MAVLLTKMRKPEGEVLGLSWLEKLILMKTFAYINLKSIKEIESEVKC